jgi:lipid II:glycine glycyltransferase (peptidoglycan interpeptide bridge formation enzyme)
LTDDFESIYKLWSKGHKSAARKAQKAGVTADIAKSHESWKDYYSIYQDSLRRWGTSATSSYGWFLFKILYDQRSINIQLWLAKFEDKSIAGALCFYHRNHVAYWHGASLSDYSQLRPTNLLMYEIIRDSCRRKAKWFDFNPSGGHDGVKAFKKSFGATSFRADLFQSQKKSRPLIQKLANYFRRKN